MRHGRHAGNARTATTLAGRAVLLAALVVAFATPAVADAASVAYVEGGEVWLASLDGTQKVRLATPVVNGDGDTENWIDIAQSDGGRIVAVRNKPGRMSNFSSFKIWEPDGTSTVEGPLNAPSGWTEYLYPLGFDITADGSHLVYGYSNSSACCPVSSARGIYVRPAANSAFSPIETVGQTSPSLFGARVISLEDSPSPAVIDVQNADGGNPYTSPFTTWFDTSTVGLDLEGVDVAADGRLAALGFEDWNGGTQTVGKIAVLAIQGVDQAPGFPAAVDCLLPADGIARDASLAQDAGAIAWKDDGGVKVAGSPTTAADPCVLGSAPVVLSPTGTHPSIGGADVAAFLPKPPASPLPQPAVPGPVPMPGPSRPAVRLTPVVTLPAKVTVKALTAKRGIPVQVKVSAPGNVSIRGTVPARRLGRRGKPVVVATGKRFARSRRHPDRPAATHHRRPEARRAGSRARGSRCGSCRAPTARRRWSDCDNASAVRSVRQTTHSAGSGRNSDPSAGRTGIPLWPHRPRTWLCWTQTPP